MSSKTQNRLKSSRFTKAIFRNREYIRTLLSGSGVNQILLDIPGLAGTTLARKLQNYEFWFVRRITLHYEPTIPDTVGGSVVIAPEYDPTDLAPTEDPHNLLTRYDGAWSGDAKTRGHADLLNLRLTSGDWVIPNLFTAPTSDLRFTAAGKFFAHCNVSGLADGYEVGRLYLDYDIVGEIAQPLVGTYTPIPQNVDVNSSSATDQATQGTDPTYVDGATALLIDNIASLDSRVGGTYDDLDGRCELRDPRGNLVAPGTRIYLSPAERALELDVGDEDIKVNPLNNTSIVGGLSLEPSGDKPCTFKKILSTGFEVFSLIAPFFL